MEEEDLVVSQSRVLRCERLYNYNLIMKFATSHGHNGETPQ